MISLRKFTAVLLVLVLPLLASASEPKLTRSEFQLFRLMQKSVDTASSSTGRNPVSGKISPAIKASQEISVGDFLNVGDELEWGDACENFASEDEFGKWAGMIMKELRKDGHEALIQGSDDLLKVCPNYSRLDIEGQRNVWVLIVNAMAFYESTCRDDAKGRGPNGKLIGLLQLHAGKEDLYVKSGLCQKGDGKTPQGTFRCGLAMMNEQLERGEGLFSRRSYWDVLRPQATEQKYKKIQKALRAYPLCK
ncbi:MAG TPA: hypothetical protein VN132_04215 [Bdellovibrio sp.]|nr:hypothetical protein [Bdellovibrio sp.]